MLMLGDHATPLFDVYKTLVLVSLLIMMEQKCMSQERLMIKYMSIL